jgi:hypothetical protein
MDTISREVVCAVADTDSIDGARGAVVAAAQGYFRRRHPDATEGDVRWAASMVGAVFGGPQAGDDPVQAEFARYVIDVTERALARSVREGTAVDARAGRTVLTLIEGLAF